MRATGEQSQATQLSLSAGALSGRRVLLLGGLGFVGLNLVPEILGVGATVRILNRSLHPLALRWLARRPRGGSVGVRQGEIRTVETFRDWLESADCIVNLAGESGAVKSGEQAVADACSNVTDHLALLEALRAIGRRPHVVFASSRLVYGVTGGVPAVEGAATRPTSIYGIHKLTVEYYHRIFWEQHSVPPLRSFG